MTRARQTADAIAGPHKLNPITIEALIEAVVIVLMVSFISLGLHLHPLRLDWRPGLVVGVTIPLVLAITFVTMYYWGVGLHKISLGSLIIALGLLVDDAIIAVEMMVARLEVGDTLRQAATHVYVSTAFPMLTGTLVTVAGFIPIGLNTSAAGEFTFTWKDDDGSEYSSKNKITVA